jgi:hypothetical protein
MLFDIPTHVGKAEADRGENVVTNNEWVAILTLSFPGLTVSINGEVFRQFMKTAAPRMTTDRRTEIRRLFYNLREQQRHTQGWSKKTTTHRQRGNGEIKLHRHGR